MKREQLESAALKYIGGEEMYLTISFTDGARRVAISKQTCAKCRSPYWDKPRVNRPTKEKGK